MDQQTRSHTPVSLAVRPSVHPYPTRTHAPVVPISPPCSREITSRFHFLSHFFDVLSVLLDDPLTKSIRHAKTSGM